MGGSRARLTRPGRGLHQDPGGGESWGKAHLQSEGQTQGSVLGSLTPVPVLMATSLDCPRVWGGHGVGMGWGRAEQKESVLADGM